MNRKVYYHKFECEHDGDVRREVMELEDAGAKVIDVREEERHGDCDYYTTVSFVVPAENVARFEAELAPLSDYHSRIETIS